MALRKMRVAIGGSIRSGYRPSPISELTDSSGQERHAEAEGPNCVSQGRVYMKGPCI